MSNLLVGCKVKYGRGDETKEGIIVNVDRDDKNYKMAWLLTQDGRIVHSYAGDIIIEPDDVKFIYALNKNYKLREKILTDQTDRFNILDL